MLAFLHYIYHIFYNAACCFYFCFCCKMKSITTVQYAVRFNKKARFFSKKSLAKTDAH